MLRAMGHCTRCGHWAGRHDEPCPHCGVGPAMKSADTAAPTSRVIAEIDAAIDAIARPTAAEAPKRPSVSPAVSKWMTELEQSPIFRDVSNPRTAALARAAESPPLRTAEPLDRVVDADTATGDIPENVLTFDEVAATEAQAAPPVLEPAPDSGPVLEPMSADDSEAPVLRPVEFADDDESPDTTADIEPVVAVTSSCDIASAPRREEPIAHVLVTFSPAGPPVIDPKAGPVAHVILALDVSGSMNRADKYPLLTQALSEMLYDLKRPGAPDVLLSVVLFAYGAETVLRDVPASKLDPREVLRKIDQSKLRFGRYTDVVGALGRAGRIAYDAVRTNKAMPVRIFLLTDGRPQDMEGARAVVERIRKMPVDVDGFAFGVDADVGALQELVSGGRGGTVKQIRSDTIVEAFGRIPEAAARVVASKAIVDVELAPGVVGGSVWRYRPGRHRFTDAFAGGPRFTTDLGTLEAGRTYSMLLQVRLPEARGDESPVGRVTVRIPGWGGPRTFEAHLAVGRHEGGATHSLEGEAATARDVLAAMGDADPREQLRALKIRRQIYAAERRDPEIIAVISRAIAELEEKGTLAALSGSDQAALMSHTCTMTISRK
ncbi:MAG: hypothetical protein HMLKMBBP_01402 [Planctomycetes bacterium]|nr:hypothetical protein [Planctomycetota bacterium]